MELIAEEGTRRRRVPPRPRGPGHRPRPQDPRVHAAGPGPRHRRGQRRARASPPTPASTASASQILVDLGVTTMRLMTNNPAKYGGLEGYGLEIVERVPLHVLPNAENIRYLRTKQEKLGHLLEHRATRATSSAARRAHADHGYVPGVTRARSTRRGCASRSSRGASTTTSRSRCSTARCDDARASSALDDVAGALGAGRVRDPAASRKRLAASGASTRSICLGAVIRGDTAALRLRGGGVRGRASRGSRSTPACRWCSACSPPTTSTRRSPAPAGTRRATRARRPALTAVEMVSLPPVSCRPARPREAR